MTLKYTITENKTPVEEKYFDTCISENLLNISNQKVNLNEQLFIFKMFITKASKEKILQQNGLV